MRSLDEITVMLAEGIDEDAVRKDYAGNDYLPGWHVIATANAVFGELGWSWSLDSLECQGSTWVARATVTVHVCDLPVPITRSDIGSCIAATPRGAPSGTMPTAEAQETARKGAATDALKRCLRTFGDRFGNGLYSGQWSSPASASAPVSIREIVSQRLAAAHLRIEDLEAVLPEGQSIEEVVRDIAERKGGTLEARAAGVAAHWIQQQQQQQQKEVQS